MKYNRCGKSGLQLPALSLGLMTVFKNDFETAREIVRRAFDAGVTHFDLAYVYGGRDKIPAEEYFGRMLKDDFAGRRDQLIISSKAADGSRKHLISKLDASLRRLGVDYVDIFYHHVPDPDTPIEETTGALDHVLRQGKALYVGISNYSVTESEAAIRSLGKLGSRFVAHQPNYNMLARWIEKELLSLLTREGIGCVAFNPLAQGLLTQNWSAPPAEKLRARKYFDAIQNSVKAGEETWAFLRSDDVPRELFRRLEQLTRIAAGRGQTLAQLSIAWVLRNPAVTSSLCGASSVEQLEENLGALQNLDFTADELAEIERLVS